MAEVEREGALGRPQHEGVGPRAEAIAREHHRRRRGHEGLHVGRGEQGQVRVDDEEHRRGAEGRARHLPAEVHGAVQSSARRRLDEHVDGRPPAAGHRRREGTVLGDHGDPSHLAAVEEGADDMPGQDPDELRPRGRREGLREPALARAAVSQRYDRHDVTRPGASSWSGTRPHAAQLIAVATRYRASRSRPGSSAITVSVTATRMPSSSMAGARCASRSSMHMTSTRPW